VGKLARAFKLLDMPLWKINYFFCLSLNSEKL